MGYHHPVGSWQGTLYLHNGKCFQMPSCPSYNCFMNNISSPTGDIGSWAKLVRVVSSDGYFLWDFFEDKCLCAQPKKFSKKPSFFPPVFLSSNQTASLKTFLYKAVWLDNWHRGGNIDKFSLNFFSWALCKPVLYSVLLHTMQWFHSVDSTLEGFTSVYSTCEITCLVFFTPE